MGGALNASSLEKKAEAGLIFLHQDAGKHAELRAQADHMADWVKVEKARLMGLNADKSAAAAEAEALRHPEYLVALEALQIARKQWYEAQFKREAAQAFIGAWQTCCANERKGV